jgi:E1A/CREB-binding protein
MTPDTDLSNINHTSVPSIDQRRQIIHQLVLLLHAHKCLQRERQATNNNDNHETTSQNLCTVPHCTTMRNVLQHMIKCGDFKNCSCKFNNYLRNFLNLFFFKVPNCVQSRHIILHWKNCTTPNCFLCGSLKNPAAFRSQNPSSKFDNIFIKKI